MFKIPPPAQTELEDIVAYWFWLSRDRQAALRVRNAIKAKLKQLGQNPLIGSPVEDTPFRVGYALKDLRFAIYYQVLGPRSIRVLTIRDTKQPKPTPTELNSRI